MSNLNEASKFSYRDPTTALKAAVEVLEKFSDKTVKSEHFSTYRLEHKNISSSPLERMIELVRTSFSLTKYPQIQHHDEENQNELAAAISIVQSHYPLIEKLKQGNPAQQKLALATLEAITRYNEVVSKIQSEPNSWSARFAQLLQEKTPTPSPIVLPKAAVIETESSKRVSECISQKAIICQPTKQEIDAFRMKAIKMIENHAMSITIQEALSSVRESPIMAASENQQAVISFRQVLHPFPGETIELEGAFQRNVHSSTISIPIPESFYLSAKSVQTGFPHPSQYCGWALSEALFPTFPLQPHKMPKLMELLERKERIAIDLLPKGQLIAKAKDLLVEKREIFIRSKESFISLYRQLFEEICKAANATVDIDSFLDLVKAHPQSYDYLSKTFNHIIEHFVKKPAQQLEEAWLDFNHEGFQSDNQEVRLKTAQEVMQNLKPAQTDFAQQMGNIIGKGAQELILQNYSDKIEYQIELSPFALKLQTAAIYQLSTFFEELLSENSDVEGFLKKNLEHDIQLFASSHIEESATDASVEIQTYFSNQVSR